MIDIINKGLCMYKYVGIKDINGVLEFKFFDNNLSGVNLDRVIIFSTDDIVVRKLKDVLEISGDYGKYEYISQYWYSDDESVEKIIFDHTFILTENDILSVQRKFLWFSYYDRYIKDGIYKIKNNKEIMYLKYFSNYKICVSYGVKK